MAKKRGSDNGSTAVLDEPEVVDDIAADLDPESPIQGPILEPDAVAVYEHEHYQEIRERNEAVRLLDEQHEKATAAKKRAKDALDDAQTQLSEFISRGPMIPGRKYAKRIRLVKEVQADTDLGENFLTIPAGELFEVEDIQEPDVLVLVTGKLTVIPQGSYEVVEWTEKPSKPAAPPKQPKRIRLLRSFIPAKGEHVPEGSEHDAIVDADGDVAIAVPGVREPFALEADEFEVIEWANPVDPSGWRLVPIDELKLFGLTPGIIDKLIGADISTLGKLLDFQQDGTPLTSIKGIAGEKEAMVADAMVAYWREHPEFCQNAAE